MTSWFPIFVSPPRSITRLPIAMRTDRARSATCQNTKAAISRPLELLGYDDVIVDISALPRMISLMTVAQLLALLDDRQAKGETSPNLHVVAAESAAEDFGTSQNSLDSDVILLTGFSGRLNSEALQNPKIWVPILARPRTFASKESSTRYNPTKSVLLCRSQLAIRDAAIESSNHISVSSSMSSMSSRAIFFTHPNTIRSKPIVKCLWRLIVTEMHWSNWAIAASLYRRCLRSCSQSAPCSRATITNVKGAASSTLASPMSKWRAMDRRMRTCRQNGR